jgi:hypothetical protein
MLIKNSRGGVGGSCKEHVWFHRRRGKLEKQSSQGDNKEQTLQNLLNSLDEDGVEILK